MQMVANPMVNMVPAIMMDIMPNQMIIHAPPKIAYTPNTRQKYGRLS